MTKPNFNVRITEYKKLNEIAGGWSLVDYQKLLTAMDCEPDEAASLDETRELCLMCLQDRPKEEAAEIVMRHRLAGKLSDGQIRNASIELADERLWQQFADLSMHEALFHVGSLMYQAYPSEYFEPDAVKISLEIESKNEAAKDLLANPLDESFLIRLLANGMSSGAIVNRLFDDQLASNSFPDASSIVWIVNVLASKDNVVTIEIISSAHWLDALKDVDSFESQAIPDELAVE